jgi:YaiO family outer membrane protein
MNVKLRIILIATVLLAWGMAAAQDQGQPLPQGASLPGMSQLPAGLNGPGYLEFGGSFFNLSGANSNWQDAYFNGLVSSGGNSFAGQFSRQDHYGDTGWYYSLGWTRVWSADWYSELDFGTSTVSGFFLPKARVDALINRKLLARKQLVLQLGAGYDLSKRVFPSLVHDFDYRGQIGAVYYFERPWIVQSGFTMTLANPGNIMAPSGFLAVTQGRVKEHYLTLKASLGREGYELFGTGQSIFDFAFQDYSVNWRQWMGPNWGFDLAVEHEVKPIYHRNGGTVGLFLDF